MTTEAERRRMLRIRLDSPIGAKVASSTVRVLDISTEGARIEHRFPLKRGNHVDLEFQVDAQSVVIPCNVIRSKYEKHQTMAVYCTGLRFVDLGDGSIALLQRILADAVARDFEARRQMLKIKK